MAGLLRNAMNEAGRPPMGGGNPGMAAAPAAEAGEEQPNVAPEEQAQYNRFVANGMKIIFSEGAAPRIIERIRASGDPIEGLAAATVRVVDRLVQSARGKGTQIGNDILMHGGIELMGNIAELASAAKVHDYTEDEIENAMYKALDDYGSLAMERGEVDKDAAMADYKTMVEADRAGRIDEVLPGMSEKAAMIRKGGGKGDSMGVPANG